jgi:hypothetical protein
MESGTGYRERQKDVIKRVFEDYKPSFFFALDDAYRIDTFRIIIAVI